MHIGNRSGLKSLNKLGADPRVNEIYKDADGIWVNLEYGFTADPKGAHDIHEYSVKEVLRQTRYIVPCSCEECEANK